MRYERTSKWLVFVFMFCTLLFDGPRLFLCLDDGAEASEARMCRLAELKIQLRVQLHVVRLLSIEKL